MLMEFLSSQSIPLEVERWLCVLESECRRLIHYSEHSLLDYVRCSEDLVGRHGVSVIVHQLRGETID